MFAYISYRVSTKDQEYLLRLEFEAMLALFFTGKAISLSSVSVSASLLFANLRGLFSYAFNAYLTTSFPPNESSLARNHHPVFNLSCTGLKHLVMTDGPGLCILFYSIGIEPMTYGLRTIALPIELSVYPLVRSA